MALKAYLQDGRVLCSSCSSPLGPGDSTCSECKETLEGDFKAIVCPSCDILLSNETSKCYNCGLKFKAISRKPESPEDEAFLWRLLKWSEEDSVKDEAAVIKPTIETEKIERFEKEEAKAEKEESIQGLVEAFKIIIGAWRKRWESDQPMSSENMKSLVNEEISTLDQLEKMVEKVEGLFNELLEKHKAEMHEKEGIFTTKPEQPSAELENIKKDLEIQLESMKSLKRELEEKEAMIKDLQDKQYQLQQENREMVDLKERLGQQDKDSSELAELRERQVQLEKENSELKEIHDEIKDVLKIVDDLLGKLTEEEIERFAKSEDFKRYEALLNKFSI